LRFPDHFPRGARTAIPVQISDLFATALHTAGLTCGVKNSVSVQELLSSKTQRSLVAEYYRPIQVLHSFPEADRANPLLKQHMQRQRAIMSGDMKYIWREKGEAELYDISNDPGEADNLLNKKEFAEAGKIMSAQLGAWVAAFGGEPPDVLENPEEKLDAEVVESLRNLGYLPG